MSAKQPLYLVVSLDVEEEGLFGGHYARRGFSTHNTASLKDLAPFCGMGIRPTLFCAHSVLADPASCETLAWLRDQHHAEIGAHLHHWNTPPLTLDGNDHTLPDTAERVPAAAVPSALFSTKLAALMKAGKTLQSQPLTSFRMGRWDLHRSHWPLLAAAGILCDASVRPLHSASSSDFGPDHFDAPGNPYWVNAGQSPIFEVPLTVTPLLPQLPEIMRALPAALAAKVRASLKAWGALALLPVYHPLWAMCAITKLYASRGGRVLSLTWHSSEMMPGCTPHLPDATAVKKFTGKVGDWLNWLHRHYNVRSLTMDELRRELGPTAPTLQGSGDWTYRAASQ